MSDKTFSQVLNFTRPDPGTYYDSAGALQTAAVDEPRFTHDPDTLEPQGLLIEEQRTNLLLWSEDFTQWDVVGTASLVSSNSETAPDGTQTADVITADGSPENRFQDQSSFTDSGQTFCQGVFVKSKGASYGEIRPVAIGGTTVDGGITRFDFTTETFSVIGSNIDNIFFKRLPDSWYFIAASFSTNGTNNTLQARITADGDLAVWGAGFEEGPDPSSYIKTEASQVTRSADNCTRTLGSEFNASEGTLLWRGVSGDSENISQVVLGVSDGTIDNRTLIRLDPSNSRIRAVSVRDGVVSSQASPSITLANTEVKIALAYYNSGWKIWADGSLQIDSTDVTGDVIADTLHLSNGPGSNQFTGVTVSAKYYPRALSDDELQELTA